VSVPDFHDLRSVAIHEAAHAVAASRLAIPVRKVELVSDGDRFDGFTHADVARAGLVDWVATLMAARIAERTILGYEVTQRHHAGSDEEQITEAIARTTRSQQVTAMAEQKARRLVTSHRPAIVGLAGALLDRALAAGGPWESFAISVFGDELAALLGGSETALLLRRAVGLATGHDLSDHVGVVTRVSVVAVPEPDAVPTKVRADADEVHQRAEKPVHLGDV
jgi:hypothetical protein